MEQHNHASHQGQTHAEWLRYANQGATRNDPLHPSLVSALSFLPSLGVTMSVVSGGQEAEGQGGSRTGSTRHDHGMAADVDFYKDGRKLDWNNAADLPLLVQIVQTAKSRGVSGIGAGDDYMGAGRFHVGFGNPGVWGAGGKGANAPKWLVDAYKGAPAGAAPVATGMETEGAGRTDRNPARLAWAYANGRMTPEDAAIYERGMQAGVFPKAEPQKQQPSPLDQYALSIAARRQRPAPRIIPLEAGLQNFPGLKG